MKILFAAMLIALTACTAQSAGAGGIPVTGQLAGQVDRPVALQEVTETPEPTEPYFDDEDPELRETFVLLTFEPTATVGQPGATTQLPTVTETPTPSASPTASASSTAQPSPTASRTPSASPTSAPSASPRAASQTPTPAASATLLPETASDSSIPLLAEVQIPRLDRAQLFSELLGSKVRNLTDGEIGSVSGLIFDSLTGEPMYALVTPRTLLIINRATVPVPWAALNLAGFGLYQPQSGVLLLPVEQTVLASAPTIDRRQWDQRAPPAGWDTGIEAYWRNYVPMIPVTGAATFSSGEAMLVDMRMLKNSSIDVTSSHGSTLGRVKDLVLDVNGQASYAVVLVDDFFGMGGRQSPVPWERLVWSPGGWFILEGSASTLKAAPGYANRSAFPDFNQQAWDREIRGYWSPERQ